MNKPRLLVFASGTKDGGGSGFENLVRRSRMCAPARTTEAVQSGGDSTQINADEELFDYEVVGVVSPFERGGVRERADRLGIPFIHMPPPYDAAHYSSIVQHTEADYVALSGWLKLAQGLDSQRTFNIHPALLSFDHGRFGGKGMYGHHIHEAVKKALDAGEITESGFSMHFVTEKLDRGPVFFEYRVPLRKGMTAEEIAAAVSKAEHEWQPKITNMVVCGLISWDGKNPTSLVRAEIGSS